MRPFIVSILFILIFYVNSCILMQRVVNKEGHDEMLLSVEFDQLRI